jgi:hypothetical protein
LFPMLSVSCSQCCLCLVPNVAVSCSQCCLCLVPNVPRVLFQKFLVSLDFLYLFVDLGLFNVY